MPKVSRIYIPVRRKEHVTHSGRSHEVFVAEVPVNVQ